MNQTSAPWGVPLHCDLRPVKTPMGIIRILLVVSARVCDDSRLCNLIVLSPIRFRFHFPDIVGRVYFMRIFRWHRTGWTFLLAPHWPITFDGILCDILTATDESNGFPRYITHCTDVPIQLAKISKSLSRCRAASMQLTHTL